MYIAYTLRGVIGKLLQLLSLKELSQGPIPIYLVYVNIVYFV